MNDVRCVFCRKKLGEDVTENLSVAFSTDFYKTPPNKIDIQIDILCKRCNFKMTLYNGGG